MYDPTLHFPYILSFHYVLLVVVKIGKKIIFVLTHAVSNMRLCWLVVTELEVLKTCKIDMYESVRF